MPKKTKKGYRSLINGIEDVLLKEEQEKLASITHYLHNIGTSAEKYFLKEAVKYLPPAFQPDLFKWDVPFPAPEEPEFTFIDLFAGIGGMRIAFQNAGGKCVFTSEWDKAAQTTYKMNFGDAPFGDITKIDAGDIPEHDVLVAGFPCQPFSIAGYRKGFTDEAGRGNLFFDISRILKKRKPKAFLLENVKNLKGHDGGNTYKIIKKELEDLGYLLHVRILNTMLYGNVPQNRERIYIVGFLDHKKGNIFDFPEKTALKKSIKDILEKSVDDKYYYNSKSLYIRLEKEVVREDTVYQWRRKYVRENKRNVCPTLTANMGMGGHNVPIIKDEKGIRKLTPKECGLFQGFPKKFTLPDIADSHLYKQFGNSVSVPVVERIAKEIKKGIK